MAFSGLITNNGSPISLKEAEDVLGLAVKASRKLREYLARFNSGTKTQGIESSAKNIQKEK